MTAQLPTIPVEASLWDQALYAFLVEKGNRSGSRRTVESYSRMLWHFFNGTTPDRVTPAVVLAYAHGIGLSGKPPSPVTIGARIACLSSYFRFLIRMGLVNSNPCDLVERPRQSPAPARGYSADEVRKLLSVVPDTIQGRRDRAILLDPCSDAVESVECASLKVPLDYEDPDSATIHLPLRRIRAVDDARREGVLVTIAGGPGQRVTDGVRPGAHTPAIERTFDIVSWDPRGTSQESLIDCIPHWDPFLDLDRTPDTASEQDALDAHITALAGGCREALRDLLPHVGTHEAALDLERLRQFLGEPQISILGSSYGSHVALLYTTLFPEHVRAVVVDGYSDPNLSPGEREIEQAAAFERELESLLAACATDPECAFHSDGTPGETFDRVMERLDRSPLPVNGDGALSQSDTYEAVAGSLVLDGDGRGRLLEALAAADDGRGRPLDDIANDIRRNYEWSGLTLGAFMAVYCADSAAHWDSLSVGEVDGITARVREVAPRLGAFLWSMSAADDLPPVGLCAMQPHLAPRSTAPVDAAGAGPILVLATTGDSTTPITAARRSLHDLEEAVLLPVEADQHLAYHYAVSRPEGPTQRCVIDAGEAYLIALEPPIRGWACPSEGSA